MTTKKNKPFIKKELQEFQDSYVAQTNSPFNYKMLETLTLDELALSYKDIDKQSQLFKGQILLEARKRFPSNIEFGAWLSVNFTELNSSNTGKLINLAKFFQDGRTLEGIPISAGYLLAAPSNEDIADKVYNQIKDKNFKLGEIKKIIEQNKYLIPNTDSQNVLDNAPNTIQIEDKKNTPELPKEDFHKKPNNLIEAAQEECSQIKQEILYSIRKFSIEEKMIVLGLLNTSNLPVTNTELIVDIPKIQNLLLTTDKIYEPNEIIEGINHLYSRTIEFPDNFSEIRLVSEKNYNSIEDEFTVKIHPLIIQSAKDIVKYLKPLRQPWITELKLENSIRFYELLYPHLDKGTFQVELVWIINSFQLTEDTNSLIESIVTPSIDELNSVSHLNIIFEVLDSTDLLFIFSKKSPQTPQLSSDEIIDMLRNWEDTFVIRDKDRIKITAEVFSPTSLVQSMLDDLPKDLISDPTKTFFDPACGNGQILSEVLIRKLENGIDYETAISNIYGADLMPDNISICRNRLLCGMEQFRSIIETNIFCADFFKLDLNDHLNNWD